MNHRARASAVFLIVAFLTGCGGRGPETAYGRSKGTSINGTSAFAEMLKQRGMTVSATSRLRETTGEEADRIVRFATSANVPSDEETEWLNEWLEAYAGRKLVYVVGDFRTDRDYWMTILDKLPPSAPATQRSRVQRRIDDAPRWASSPELPIPKKKAERPRPTFSESDPTPLFALDDGGSEQTCTTLSGPWADGVDAKAAALPVRRAPIADVETVLLEGNQRTLVLRRSIHNDSEIVVIANGAFLLNAALVNPARRPLAEKVVDWIAADVDEEPGPDVSGEGLHTLFLEGSAFWAMSMPKGLSAWELLNRPPLGMIAGHLGALGILACLSRAVRLGRPRDEPSTGADRPVAHAEALGDLLQRSRAPDVVDGLLQTSRRTRPTHASDVPAAPPTSRRRHRFRELSR